MKNQRFQKSKTLKLCPFCGHKLTLPVCHWCGYRAKTSDKKSKRKR